MYPRQSLTTQSHWRAQDSLLDLNEKKKEKKKKTGKKKCPHVYVLL